MAWWRGRALQLTMFQVLAAFRTNPDVPGRINAVEPSYFDRRPVIEYPCPWEYKAIGWDETAMREAITEIMADRQHDLSFSRTSGAGRYCSMLLVVTVESEDHRNAIYRALQEHRHIRMVL
jgi:putative lipoic acid-binding regulatory protein